MSTRVAIIGIIVENMDSVPPLNTIFHAHADYIIGRMGIPYREQSYHVISIAVDAPNDVITSLMAQIRKLEGVLVKATCSKTCDAQDF